MAVVRKPSMNLSSDNRGQHWIEACLVIYSNYLRLWTIERWVPHYTCKLNLDVFHSYIIQSETILFVTRIRHFYRMYPGLTTASASNRTSATSVLNRRDRIKCRYCGEITYSSSAMPLSIVTDTFSACAFSPDLIMPTTRVLEPVVYFC